MIRGGSAALGRVALRTMPHFEERQANRHFNRILFEVGQEDKARVSTDGIAQCVRAISHPACKSAC